MGNQQRSIEQQQSMELLTAYGYKNNTTPPYQASFVEGALHDSTRRKDLQIRLYYPSLRHTENRIELPDKLPVIIFSHGLLGSKEGYQVLGEHLASWGYVCIHPTHEDSLKLKRDHGGAFALFKDGGIKAHIQREVQPQKWLDRVADVVLILDSLSELQEWPKQQHASTTYLVFDTDRIGMGGHSYGAYTSQLIGGAKVFISNDTNREEGKPTGLVDLADHRVKATLLISPQGIARDAHWGGLQERSWADYRCPLMVITGTKDSFALTDQLDDPVSFRSQPFIYSPVEPKYKVVLQDADHGMGGISSAPLFHRLMGWQTNPYQVECVKLASLAFFDATLKKDEEAIRYLGQTEIPLFSYESKTNK